MLFSLPEVSWIIGIFLLLTFFMSLVGLVVLMPAVCAMAFRKKGHAVSRDVVDLESSLKILDTAKLKSLEIISDAERTSLQNASQIRKDASSLRHIMETHITQLFDAEEKNLRDTSISIVNEYKDMFQREFQESHSKLSSVLNEFETSVKDTVLNQIKDVSSSVVSMESEFNAYIRTKKDEMDSEMSKIYAARVEDMTANFISILDDVAAQSLQENFKFDDHRDYILKKLSVALDNSLLFKSKPGA